MIYRFFGGKGGVGKTTCAAAEAVALAHAGKRVLIVSTDPAHSLGDALELALGPVPVRVKHAGKGVLEAAELDADLALDRWIAERRRNLGLIAERGTYLDREDVERFLDLSFPGVDELIGLVELVRMAESAKHDVVVVDTAPTGHTLRLLQMPETLRRIAVVFDDMQAKHRLMSETIGRNRYRADASDDLIEEIDRHGRTLAEALRDPKQTEFRWVMLPEELSIEESKDGLKALAEEKIPVTEVIVNRMTRPPPGQCALCEGRIAAEAAAASRIRKEIKLPLRWITAREQEPRGVEALRAFGAAGGTAAAAGTATGTGAAAAAAAATVVASRNPFPIAIPAGMRLVFFGGKGGVGKTSAAATTAIATARREPSRRILLLSTDPAHSLGDALAMQLGDDERKIPGAPANLVARELDAPKAFAERRDSYRRAVDEFFDGLRGGSRFDPTFDRAIVRDLIDLAPPGIDELFAILTVIDALFAPAGGTGSHDLVIVDTAPTGHALRLLELPASAHDWVKAFLSVLLKYREVIPPGKLSADLVELAKGLRLLRAVLVDPARCAFVPVTRPAALPRAETERLLAALDALGILVPLVMMNGLTPPGCTRCRAAATREEKEIRSLERSRRAIVLAPSVAPPPRGAVALGGWSETWSIRETHP